MISAAENSNKFQKTRFWKEKSVEAVVTLGQWHSTSVYDREQENIYIYIYEKNRKNRKHVYDGKIEKINISFFIKNPVAYPT